MDLSREVLDAFPKEVVSRGMDPNYVCWYVHFPEGAICLSLWEVCKNPEPENLRALVAAKRANLQLAKDSPPKQFHWKTYGPDPETGKLGEIPSKQVDTNPPQS